MEPRNPLDSGNPPVVQPGAAPGQPPAGVYNSPSLAATPYNAQQTLQPQVVSGGSSPYPIKKAGPNKLVMVIIAGVVVLLVLGVAAAVLGSGKKTNNQATQSTTDANKPQDLQPAQAIDLEQTGNAISQDLSSLDDEKDFPTDSLEDKTLGL